MTTDDSTGISMVRLPDGEIEATVDLQHPDCDKNMDKILALIDPRYVVPEVVEKPRQTLSDLLRLLSDSESAMTQDIDPEALVGDVRDKVDAIKYVVDKLEFQENWCRAQAAPFSKAAQTLQRNRERLKEYVVFCMKQEKFEAVPGTQFKARLQDNPPALEMIKPEADALDRKNWPTYCRQVVYYEWDKAAIKDALALNMDLPFARLKRGQHVRFDINVPEKVPAKIKGKKK